MTRSRAGPVAPGDDALMARVQAGSVDAFGELYDRYCGRAYQLAWSVCFDHCRAEEAVQDAFLAIWESRATYHPQRGTLAAWLLTVVRHRAIDVARRYKRHVAQRASYDQLDARPASDDTANQAIDRAEADRLHHLLARLPEPQREVVALAFYGQLTHAEIAKQLDLPAGTVKGRMRLGLKKLREASSGSLPGRDWSLSRPRDAPPPRRHALQGRRGGGHRATVGEDA